MSILQALSPESSLFFAYWQDGRTPPYPVVLRVSWLAGVRQAGAGAAPDVALHRHLAARHATGSASPRYTSSARAPCERVHCDDRVEPFQDVGGHVPMPTECSAPGVPKVTRGLQVFQPCSAVHDHGRLMLSACLGPVRTMRFLAAPFSSAGWRSHMPVTHGPKVAVDHPSPPFGSPGSSAPRSPLIASTRGCLRTSWRFIP
jgi:hypothetical protein